MQSLSLITVTTAGAPQKLSATSLPCRSINIQPMKGPITPNAGNIYIGKAGMNKTTLANVLYVLASGQPATTVQDAATFKDDASNYWVDADNSGDGILVSYS